jgi:hypothetical protein
MTSGRPQAIREIPQTAVRRNYKEHKERIIKTGWIKPFAILGGVHKTSENWQDNNFPIIARIVLL